MALVPIRCPNCGAAVELDEGQTLVRCAYCNTSSYLDKPAALAPAAPVAPALRPAQQAALPRSTPRSTHVIILVACLLLAGLMGALFFVSGAGFDHYQDATAAAELLKGELGKDARYNKIYLQPKYMYVEAMKGKQLVSLRVRGREVEEPKPISLSGPNAKLLEDKLFRLADVDFTAVGKITADATKRAKGGKPSGLALERRLPYSTELQWQATVDVGGKAQIFVYRLDGTPLVDKELDFITAAPEDLGKWFRTRMGFEPSVVSISLGDAWASVTAMTKGSKRDTDTYRFRNDGTMAKPAPDTNDGDAEALAKQVFSLKDVNWAIVPKVAAVAAKQMDAKVTQVQVYRQRSDGTLEFYVLGSSERGASRSARFTMKGTFIE